MGSEVVSCDMLGSTTDGGSGGRINFADVLRTTERGTGLRRGDLVGESVRDFGSGVDPGLMAWSVMMIGVA